MTWVSLLAISPVHCADATGAAMLTISEAGELLPLGAANGIIDGSLIGAAALAAPTPSRALFEASSESVATAALATGAATSWRDARTSTAARVSFRLST